MASHRAQLNDDLERLHRLHQDRHAAQAELDKGPRQITLRQTHVTKRQQEVEARKARLKQLRMSADQKNLQLKSAEARISDWNAKLLAAATNREYEILTKQIEADKMAKSVLEDEIYEALTLIDQAQIDVAKAEADVKQAEADLEQTKLDVTAREPGIRQRVGELEAAVTAAEAVIPAAAMAEYRRLVQAHGAEALAPLSKRSCTGCFVALTQQLQMELSAGQIKFCRSCGKLLYIPADEQ